MLFADTPVRGVLPSAVFPTSGPATPTSTQRSERLKFVVYKSDSLFNAMSEQRSENRSVNSWVVSASVGKEKVEGLDKNNTVKIKLYHSKPVISTFL